MELYWRSSTPDFTGCSEFRFRPLKGEARAMFGRLGTFCLLVGYFSLCTLAATAQEVVHALTGTVTSMNPGKTIRS